MIRQNIDRLFICGLLVCGISSASVTRAGYEQPPYIDGCRSMDGRFEVTAVQTLKAKSGHGPNKWNFIWKDLKEGKTVEFEAQGIQGGQIFAHLFVAPDGETFALWNHITMFWKEKSHMHASSHSDVIPRDQVATEEYRNQPIFSNRLIIYRKDGSIIKSLSVGDFMRDDGDWKYVLPVFNRVEWLRPYDGMSFKNTKRTGYAFYRVSPDYTVLEFQVGNPKTPRVQRVSLIDGELIPDDRRFEQPNQIPVRPFLGDAHNPKSGKDWLEAYTPSLDPVRVPGSYRIDTIEQAYPQTAAPKKLPEFKVGEVKLLKDGFAKADTPSWLPKPPGKGSVGRLFFTDLEKQELYQFVEPDKFTTHSAGSRGRIADDKRFYGLIDGRIVSWAPLGKEPPHVLVNEGIDGREVSLNDLAISAKGLVYFTTLKDPEKGRLSLLDPKTGQVTVLFDGIDEPALANPNGIALSPRERFLYVGISNYKNRKHSGVYAFPVLEDGTIDVEAGKAKPRIPVKAPDGIAVDKAGNVYFTAGNTVHVYTPYAKQLAKIKIPKGSGTNLCFGGEDRFRRTLFITTWNALYSVETPIGK